MQVFRANKGYFWLYLLVFFLLPVGVVFLFNEQEIPVPWAVIGMVYVPFLLLLWVYLSTVYKIDNEIFYYQSAFLKGEIPIHSIKKINNHTTLWVGKKVSMATNGIIITFGYDEVYVAPINNQELIDALVKINPSIQII